MIAPFNPCKINIINKHNVQRTTVTRVREYESMRGSKMIGRSAQTLGSLGVGS